MSVAHAQRITDGLVVGYDFFEGSGTVIGDQSGVGTPLNLNIHEPDKVSWGAGFITFTDATIVSSASEPFVEPEGSAMKLFNAITTSDEITLEAWVLPENDVENDGPARIMNMGIDHVTRNFFLGQRNIDYEARLRTTSTDANGNNIKLRTAEGPVNLELQHVVYTRDVDGEASIYVDGELAPLQFGNNGETPIDGDTSNWDDSFDFTLGNEATWERSPGVDRRDWLGDMHLIAVYDRALSSEEVQTNFAAGHMALIRGGAVALRAGDADQDLDFDQLDLVQVQIAAKYLTGQAATWGEGDWDGAPGGTQGSPPQGNGFFDQLDIIVALAGNLYLTGPYGAVAEHPNGDGNATLRYNPSTGELAVEAGPTELTSINIDSAGAIFTGEAATNLGGSFDNDSDNNIFKATFGSSFGSLTFGNVAQTGLSKEFVLNDLTVVGSLAGGGDLGNVDLVYVPEPSTVFLMALGLIGIAGWLRRTRC